MFSRYIIVRLCPIQQIYTLGNLFFFICQLKASGSGLVATIPRASRHSRKVISVIHFYKLCFVIFQLSICNMDCSFSCFLLGHKNMKLVINLASIMNDDPLLHLDVVVDFYMFRPAAGCTLFGK